MNTEARVKQRRAIEALRAGVPNRDAVLALGCSQPGIEEKFRQQLARSAQSASNGRMTPGMLVQGDFGSGKSHLFEYLQHVALEENFICSKVVISKETPLYDPVKMYRAAIEGAVAPHKTGAALTEVAMSLKFNTPAYADLYDWVHRSSGHLNAQFAAMLFLFQHRQSDPELADRIIRFWSGDKFGIGDIKRSLRAVRETVTYKIDRIPVRELALQRFRFTSRLMLAAGYSGWILLIDETELIGRYSLTQRAKSYAELARWMGKLEGSSYSGLTAVFAITEDFTSAVLQDKEDMEKVPAKMRAKGSEVDILLASQAEQGMRIIERKETTLERPSADTLEKTKEKVRKIHADAFAWDPPPIRTDDTLHSAMIREHVKRWITELDLKRLDPDYEVDLDSTELKQIYVESPDLEVPPDEEQDGASA